MEKKINLTVLIIFVLMMIIGLQLRGSLSTYQLLLFPLMVKAQILNWGMFSATELLASLLVSSTSVGIPGAIFILIKEY
jgi:hypothetical protein